MYTSTFLLQKLCICTTVTLKTLHSCNGPDICSRSKLGSCLQPTPEYTFQIKCHMKFHKASSKCQNVLKVFCHRCTIATSNKYT